MHKSNRSKKTNGDKQPRGCDHLLVAAPRFAACRVQANQQRRDTENQKDVGGVRTDDIAQCKTRQSAAHSVDRNDKLWCRSSEGNDGETDNQRRNAHPEAQVNRALDQGVTGKNEDEQTKTDIEEIHLRSALSTIAGIV